MEGTVINKLHIATRGS